MDQCQPHEKFWTARQLSQVVNWVKTKPTLDSGINIGVRLLIFGLFPRGYILIREGNAYFFSEYPLFDGIGDAYFKGYA